ncbi:MAG: hypothetical protein KF886_01070 [Candidatus Hydrogenedentes bacterium]|nr:hypothetical protein [Candidatus Hydrogenedentota bacterium]
MSSTVLFTAGELCVTPPHVLSAAAFWGHLPTLLESSRHRLACLDSAAARAIEAPDKALQAASESFRRSRGLRTVQATEQWMAAWGVEVEAFTGYLEREALRAQIGDEAPAAADESRLAGVLWPDAVFGGQAASWLHPLAARAAVRCEGGATDVPGSLFDPASSPGLAPDALRVWSDRLDLPATWFDELVAMEAGFLRFAERQQTPARLDAALRARWESLFVADIETASFPTEAAAREALLCITEDGEPMSAVCSVAGGSYQSGRAMLGDLPVGVRAHALSAPPDTLLPIFSQSGVYTVCRVRGKTEPSLDDPRIRSIVAGAVVSEAVQPLIQRHVAWSPGVSP